MIGALSDNFTNAMLGYAPQNVPALPEGQIPNPAAPVIRNDPQPGMFGALGFQPMSQGALSDLGISSPVSMEFRTPRYDQPFTPFGMHTLDPFGYNQQFPPVDATPDEPDIGGPGPVPDPQRPPGWMSPSMLFQDLGAGLPSPADIARYMVTNNLTPFTWMRTLTPRQRERFSAEQQLGGGGG